MMARLHYARMRLFLLGLLLMLLVVVASPALATPPLPVPDNPLGPLPPSPDLACVTPGDPLHHPPYLCHVDRLFSPLLTEILCSPGNVPGCDS